MRGFALLILLPMACLLHGQQEDSLEEKREALMEELRHTGQLLEETQKNKALTYERYLTTQEQIRTRKELIHNIQTELSSHDASLEDTAEAIASLEQDMARLKEDYETLLQMAYRQKLLKSDLLFIFSADNFNEAFKRWQYLKQYDRYRKEQALRIIETQKALTHNLEWRESQKAEQEGLLSHEKEQLSLLEEELKLKNQLLRELKRNEQELRAKIRQQQARHESLNRAIEEIIGGNILAQQPADAEGDGGSTMPDYTPFENQRGRLPWPAKGVISSYFGKQSHPTLKDITINNSGIDILTHKEADIQPVASGEVAAVRLMPGNGYLVIVQHGDYYTLYSNLEEHFVKKGDRVSASQKIGRVMTDEHTGKTELHFEIWKQHTRLNPKDWMKK